MKKSTAYLSDSRPKFTPFEIDCGRIPAYRYNSTLKAELKARTLPPTEAVAILEDMLVIRELEEMIVKLRSGAYDPIRDFNYRGPTHVSVGQEGAAAGACCALQLPDNITSTHRGHGESLAKGTVAIRQMTDEQLRRRVPQCPSSQHEDLVQAALEEHVYRTICELFGKDDGYCRGRGGSMHIADFSVGHLGANAIVGGGVPIATGAALANRYLERGNVVCCFAGDGAYANGVVLESLNFAVQAQFTNHLASGRKSGLPIIFLVCNNHYGMTHRTDDEVMGVEHIARRPAGFADNNMHSEIVNGMNVLAVRDAVLRAAKLCRATNTAPRRRKRPGKRLIPSRRLRKNCWKPGCWTLPASPPWRNAWPTATPAPPNAPPPPPIQTPGMSSPSCTPTPSARPSPLNLPKLTSRGRCRKSSASTAN
jgi:2-oxoisovalerate dehydrogenase E1 component